MAAEEECDYLFKAVLVGDAAVGEVEPAGEDLRRGVPVGLKPTIGVEFAYRDVRIGGSLIKAQIWDTAGQERFRAINSSYYRGALGALLVYDITRKSTFINLVKWLQEMRDFGNDDIVIMLIGNKSDRHHMREVSEDEGGRFAEQEGLYFMETSALENKNVEEAFLQIVTRIHEITSQKSLDSKLSEARKPSVGQIIIVDEVSATKKEPCCLH